MRGHLRSIPDARLRGSSRAVSCAPVSETDRDSVARARARALAVFAALWAAAAIFDIGSYHEWGRGRWVIITALWVLLQPRSTLALVALAAAGLVHVVLAPPLISNHQLFAGLVDATILASAAALALSRRRLELSAAALYGAVAPAARLALLGMYFFAVFHKLNRDWFDPAFSCGAAFSRAPSAHLAWLPPTAAITAALGSEILIPVLLAIRRTRYAGLLLGALFHVALSLNPFEPFYNFSSMLLASFVLFADPVWLGRVVDRVGARTLRRAAWTLAALLFACAVLRWHDPRPTARDPFLVLWTVYASVLIGGFIVLLARDRPRWPVGRQAFRLMHPALALLPALVILTGVTPYLGLKTELAFAMYSNLRTEGGRSNHLIIPASWQIFDYQRDLVQVTASSDRALQATANKHEQIPYFELRRHPTASVSYVRAGVAHSFDHIRDDPHNPGTPSWIASKWLIFRPVSGEHQPCVH
jgi:hypothetical protein